jgi:hypothetical protein
VAKVGTSKAGGTISQQAVVHPWLAAGAHGNKQTNKQASKQTNKETNKQANKQTNIGLHVKYPFCLPDFNQT